MVLVGASGRFYDVSSSNPGSFHDSKIAMNSALFKSLEEGRFIPFYDINGTMAKIIGDSAYRSNLDSLMVPIPKAEAISDPMKTIFNIKFKKARNVVERFIGVLKNRFRILDSCIRMNDIDDASHLIQVCVALHNMIIMHPSYESSLDTSSKRQRRSHPPKKVPGLSDVSTSDSDAEEPQPRRRSRAKTTSLKIMEQYSSFFVKR